MKNRLEKAAVVSESSCTQSRSVDVAVTTEELRERGKFIDSCPRISNEEIMLDYLHYLEEIWIQRTQ